MLEFDIPQASPKVALLPINDMAKSKEFKDSEIFGITDDLLIVLELFRKEGLSVPDNDFVGQLRGRFIKLFAESVTNVPLYFH